MDEQPPSPPGTSTPRQQPNWRSQASSNWRVKDASPRVDQAQSRTRPNRSDAQAQGQGSADEGAAGTRLYVGNLLYTAQRADIEELFAERGFTVAGVSISVDPFTGRNPSYCFVDLDSPEEAQRAIADLNGVDVRGRALRVSPGVAKRGSAQGQGQGQGQPASGGREVRVKNFERGWKGESREERNTEYKPSYDRWSRPETSSHFQAVQAAQSEGRRLYVGNLPRIEPQSAVDEEVQSLFATYLADTNITPAAVSKLISPHPSKATEPGNHYYCFVDLERAEDMDLVIEKLAAAEGSWGGSVRVNRARDQRDRERGAPGEKRGGREQGGRGEGREQGARGDGERRGPPGGGSAWRKDEGQE